MPSRSSARTWRLVVDASSSIRAASSDRRSAPLQRRTNSAMWALWSIVSPGCLAFSRRPTRVNACMTPSIGVCGVYASFTCMLQAYT